MSTRNKGNSECDCGVLPILHRTVPGRVRKTFRGTSSQTKRRGKKEEEGVGDWVGKEKEKGREEDGEEEDKLERPKTSFSSVSKKGDGWGVGDGVTNLLSG